MAPTKQGNSVVMGRVTIAFFFLVGGGLLALALWAYSQGTESPKLSGFWSQVFMNGGFVFLTVGVLDLMWRFLGGNPVDQTLEELKGSLANASSLAGDSARTGLARVFSVGSDYKKDEEWMAFLASARERVDIMAYTAHSWVRGNDFVNIVASLVNNGVKVRLVFMDESNEEGIRGKFIGDHKRPENANLVVSHIGVTRDFLRQMEQAIKPNRKANFQWRAVKKGNITMHVSRVDNTLVAIPYLMCRAGNSCPGLEVRGTDKPLFKAYMEELERFWELGA